MCVCVRPCVFVLVCVCVCVLVCVLVCVYVLVCVCVLHDPTCFSTQSTPTDKKLEGLDLSQ